MTSSRPRLTISEAVVQFNVSRSTVKRNIDRDNYPGSMQDKGSWRIPVEALHALHKPRSGPTTNQVKNQSQPAVNQDHDLVHRVQQLEAQIAVAEARREAAERVAEAEQRRAETAERALLMLTPGTQAPAQPAEIRPATTQQAAEPFGRRLLKAFKPRA